MTTTRRPVATWPPGVERLARRIAVLELEAQLVTCDPSRAALRRLEAKRLAGELEAMKATLMAGETATQLEITECPFIALIHDHDDS